MLIKMQKRAKNVSESPMKKPSKNCNATITRST